MTNRVQHESLYGSIWSMCFRPSTASLVVGTALLLTVPAARSQEVDAAKPVYSVLYTFTGGADGGEPGVGYGGAGAGLTRDKAGTLFGTTFVGGDETGYCGSGGCGVVFKLDAAGKETVLHAFTGPPDGYYPAAAMVRDEEGNLYGTTSFGGSASLPAGTVFKLDPAGKETILYSFTGGADGNTPGAGVIRDEAGNLYGTTIAGGASNYGVVFRLDPAGTETVLYGFTGGADGKYPQSSLIRDKKGNLYGTTQVGGSSDAGTVFKLDPTGKETVLYTFTGGADGARPFAPLVRDAAGDFYGTASGGGASGNGVVFGLDPTGRFTVLHTFTGGTDGAIPYGDLFRDDEGRLYGTAFAGGNNTDPICAGFGCGVVFRLDRAGNETVLYTFSGSADGDNPYVGLVRDAEGNFYGTTGYGGDLACGGGFGCGVVFKLKP